MIGLAYGSAGRFGAGAVSNVIVEMENGWMFVTGIRDGSLMCVVTTKSADIGTIGYEIAVFADRAGDVLTPEVREELKCLMLSREWSCSTEPMWALAALAPSTPTTVTTPAERPDV